MSRRLKLLWLAPLVILAAIGFVALGGAIVQALWNWLVPSIVGWRAVSFWQALGLLALCRILFGGIGGPRGPHAGIGERWRHRCESMTPEERERLRMKIGVRWGHQAPEADTASSD